MADYTGMSKTSSSSNTTPVCFLQVPFRDHVQESYETASGHAAIRARQLRKAGFRAFVSAMGSQVTGVGLIKLSLVTAYGDMDNLPPVKLERI
jgi:hypothetical protein